MKLRGIKVLLMGLLIIAISCDKLKEVPEDKFVGVWQLQGRDMFEGIQIKIERENEKLVGRIIKLNDNKLVNMFVTANDVWVSDISRASNFEFKLVEKKIARDLFSVYGLPTSQEFKVQFIDNNTIGLGTDSANPQNSAIKYKRVTAE